MHTSAWETQDNLTDRAGQSHTVCGQSMCFRGDASHFVLSSWRPRASKTHLHREASVSTETVICSSVWLRSEDAALPRLMLLWAYRWCLTVPIILVVWCVSGSKAPLGDYNGFVSFHTGSIKTHRKTTESVAAHYVQTLTHQSPNGLVTALNWKTQYALFLSVYCRVLAVWGGKCQCLLYETSCYWCHGN